MREIRLALLEADVNFKVAKEFVDAVRERALGAEVLGQLNPGQTGRQDRPRGADGDDGRRAGAGDRVRVAPADRDPDRRPAGLGQDDGRGKARAAAARPSTGARSRSRPATRSARRRSSSSWSSASAPARQSTSRAPSASPVEIARWALERARTDGKDVLIVDTAGRLHVDAELMDELVAMRGGGQARPDAARRRRDDRPGRGQRRRAVRRGGPLRRRRADQARRRRPRRRRAVGARGHRQADPVRLDRREARRSSSASTPTAWRSGSSGWATS